MARAQPHRYRRNPYGRDTLEALLRKASDPRATGEDLADIYDTFVSDNGEIVSDRISDALAGNPAVTNSVLLKLASENPHATLRNPGFQLTNLMDPGGTLLAKVFKAYEAHWQARAMRNEKKLTPEVKQKVGAVLLSLYKSAFPGDPSLREGGHLFQSEPGYVGGAAIGYMDKQGRPDVEQYATGMVAYAISLLVTSMVGGPSFHTDGLALFYAKPLSALWVRDLDDYLENPP